MTEDGAESNHQEVKMTLKMTSVKFKKIYQLSIKNTGWSAIFNYPDFSTEYCNKAIEKTKNSITYDDIQYHIRKIREDQAVSIYGYVIRHLLPARCETATTTKKKCVGCY